MLFNSIDFAVFIPIVFGLYWFLFSKSLKLQNLLIVVASYVFYGWWDWRFLTLILFSTLVDFTVGIKLSQENVKSKRRLLLLTSVLVNLGFLGFFKYYDFFLVNFTNAFTVLGYNFDSHSLNIILPVGISFYTFQTLSYTIDIYRKKLNPTNDIIAFSAFVSFFPQLVAGPIERATNLLPQFYKERKFEYSNAVDGMRQILWGLFKKVVIADNCAVFVSYIFDNSSELSGSSLALGAVLFSFQIYCDFSGYSDIAIGTSRLFGFNLKQNFAFPYFSRDIAEFWRRWHISLSTWFRDYLYIPLGGSRGGVLNKVRNTLIIFVVSGFWHGANWKFIIWGALNAIYFLPLLLTNKNRVNLEIVAKDNMIPSISECLKMSATFSLVAFAWIFFRAENFSHATSYIEAMFSVSLFSIPEILTPKITMVYTLLLIPLLLVTEWLQRGRLHGLSIERLRRPARWMIYTSVLIMIVTFGKFGEAEFIYFQF
jgi:alginate O-acetyltransferase complex protein AlgI